LIKYLCFCFLTFSLWVQPQDSIGQKSSWDYKFPIQDSIKTKPSFSIRHDTAAGENCLEVSILNTTNLPIQFLDNIDFFSIWDSPDQGIGFSCYLLPVKIRTLKKVKRVIYMVSLDSASEFKNTAKRKIRHHISGARRHDIQFKTMIKSGKLIELPKGQLFTKRLKIQNNIFSKSSYEFPTDTISFIANLNFYYSNEPGPIKRKKLRRIVLGPDTIKLCLR